MSGLRRSPDAITNGRRKSLLDSRPLGHCTCFRQRLPDWRRSCCCMLCSWHPVHVRLKEHLKRRHVKWSADCHGWCCLPWLKDCCSNQLWTSGSTCLYPSTYIAGRCSFGRTYPWKNRNLHRSTSCRMSWRYGYASRWWLHLISTVGSPCGNKRHQPWNGHRRWISPSVPCSRIWWRGWYRSLVLRLCRQES